MADLAAQHVVRGNAANRESAAVKIHKHRQFLRRWRIQARRYGVTVAHRNAEIIDPCQDRLGDFKHAGTGFVSSPSLLRRERMKWRALGAGHAAEDAPHGRRQQAFRRFEMHQSNATETRADRRGAPKRLIAEVTALRVCL